MTVAGGPTCCLVVPAGTFDPAPLADAIRATHSDADITAVWCGDPHRRPRLADGIRWADLQLDEPVGIGWGRLLAALAPRTYEWVRAARAAERLLVDGAPAVAMLRVGSVGVLGGVSTLLPSSGVVALDRAPTPLPLDGLAPAEADIATEGRWSSAMLGVAVGARSVLTAIADAGTMSSPADPPGALFDLALVRHLPSVTPCDGALAVGWVVSVEHAAPDLIDIDHVDRSEIWHVRFGDRRPRTLLSTDVALADQIVRSCTQWAGERSAVELPGGIAVDPPIRTLVSESIRTWARGEGDLPPDPYESAGFLDWLESPTPRTGGALGRYWFEEWVRRPDLHVTFPRPTGADGSRFADWAANSWRSDGRSALIRPTSLVSRPRWVDADRRRGINLIGYVAADSGLGDFTRRVDASLAAARVPHGALHYHRSASPHAADTPPLTTELSYDTNLITVHVDQMRLLRDDHGTEVFPGRKNIGYWFWELSHLPPHLVANIELVDEVWTATEFVADAFRAVTDQPVRVVPVPVPEPTWSELSRTELGLPEDRFVFLVTLDHLSITDRKNPMGAIRAFERAFPDPAPDGPVLVVKTLNAAHRWSEHEELQLAAARRPDVIVTDRHLDRAGQMALIRSADVLVSLHRSEGLGLHLMEAMWLGTPVIATRYSGNLDVMDDDNAMLVDHTLIPVTDRQGYYPPEATWADPDLDQAAAAMIRLHDDSALLGRIAAAGRASMAAQPSLTHTGHLIAGLDRQVERSNEE